MLINNKDNGIYCLIQSSKLFDTRHEPDHFILYKINSPNKLYMLPCSVLRMVGDGKISRISASNQCELNLWVKAQDDATNMRMHSILRKALHEDVKMNQWEFHKALSFFRLITV